MNKVAIFAVVLACFAAVAVADDVVVLTDSSFDDFVKGEALTMVEFYAPWCGHCKKLEPEYTKAASELKEVGIKIAKVDSTKEKDVSSKFKIEGFPTIKIFKNGEEAGDYQGERSADAIVNYLKKRSGPPVAEAADAAAITKLKEDNEVVIVYFGKKEGAAFDAFEKAADKEEAISFYYCADEAAAKEHQAAVGSVVVFKKFDEGRADLTENITAESVAELLDSNRLPLVTEFNDANAQKIFGGNIKVHTLLIADTGSDSYAKTLESFQGAAKAFKGKTIFVSVDKSQEGVVNFFGVKPEDMPAIRVVDLNAGMKKYSFEEKEITTDSVSTFVNNFFDGKLSPALKSQEPPESNDGPVKVVVGKTFEQEVFHDDKDVLIELYAPWCGHCKSLAPIWDQLGEKMKDNDHIVIAKMDAESNETSHIEVSGFPTIKFLKAGTKEFVDYSGDRTLDAFVDYLKKNASKPIKDEL